MPQLDYSTTQPIGFAGQLSDVSFKRIGTGVNKVASAIPFGVAVKRGAAEGEYLLPVAIGDKVEGIVIHSHDVDQRNLTGVQGVDQNAVMNVLEEGSCYVKVENAVAKGDAVTVRYAAGAGGTQLGGFRGGAIVTNETAVVKGAQFRRGAVAGGLAEVEFSKLVNLS